MQAVQIVLPMYFLAKFVCIKKYTACEKIGVKVNRFLKIVFYISNLDKSIHINYKIRKILTSGLEIYAIWIKSFS